MRALIAAALLLLSSSAKAFITVNEGLPTTKDAVYVGTTTPQLLLNGGTFYAGTVPSVSLKASSNVVIGNDACVIYATGSITCLGVNLSTAGTGPFVMRTGDTMTGPLSISATGAAVYDLSLSTSISFTQSAGNGLGIRWGDGSISTTASSGGGGSPGPASSMTITAVSDNFLGQVTGSLKTFTLSNTPANAAALSCYLDGLLLSQTSDYIYTPPSTVAITTAPAANSTGFFCNYFVNTSTLPAAFILTSTQSVTGSTTFLGAVHASSGSHVTFPSTLAYTTPQASFLASVTGSTISFTVQGTTVACWTSGSVGSNGTSFINLGIMVDGSVSFIPGTSSTVGIFDQNNQGSGSCMGIGTYNEFQVTGGGASHTFSIGFWSPAPNTETFPCNSTSKSISQFGCREVLSQ